MSTIGLNIASGLGIRSFRNQNNNAWATIDRSWTRNARPYR